MKKFYFLLIALGLYTSANTQNINFSNVKFKAILLEADSNNQIAKNLAGDYFKIDANNDGEIQLTEASNVTSLKLFDELAGSPNYVGIDNIIGINAFENLKFLYTEYNFFKGTLDLTENHNLEEIIIGSSICEGFDLINLSGLTNLVKLSLVGIRQVNHPFTSARVNVALAGCANLVDLNISNSFVNINYCEIPNLKYLNSFYLEGGEPEIFDFSCLNKLETLNISENVINVLILKNGSLLNSLFYDRGYSSGYPRPKFICIDDNSQELQQILNSGLIEPNTVVNSYCSFEPGGQYFTIKGKNKFDTNNNGCDEFDRIYPNLKLITNETKPETIISNSSGEYKTFVQAGNIFLTPIIENPTYFTISPTNVTVTFPTQASPFIQDFCVTPNGTHHDVEVSVIPTEAARPGFDAKYKIIYKNKGNQVENGSISLNFDDSKMDFVSSSATPIQSTGLLTWDYTNLQPFETKTIDVVFNINSPMESPAVNGGDVLSYTTTVSSGNSDEMPNDNTFTLNQTVVNSFDPNDITCLEGTKVSTSKIGDYVHYMIRFENTGSANATNIVVKDVVDNAKYDVNSIIPIKGSHDFYTRINGNNVEFIFEDINLPFDDATNDGYVSFKLKTKASLVVGDTFSKNANIYFDYNFPITTNTATTIIAALANQDFEFETYFNLFPNPASSNVTLETKSDIELYSVQVYNTLGQLVLVVPHMQTSKTMDVSSLSTGNYFIKIKTNKGTSHTKFVKQ
ncbi:DUF7619 domain-containing protein [Flavobacterium sp.]|uniref:DUF7619 domain-containing protein n=1 Tax=Flavobacterium sp. TaxID=239 RepID=UPI003D13B333